MEASADGNIRALVRVRLKYPDLERFVDRYAGHLTQEVIFVPSRHPCAVGSNIRFELTLVSGEVVFSGEGDVIWVKEVDPAGPAGAHGMGVRFTGVSASSVPVLERLLERREELRRCEPKRSSAAPPATVRKSEEPRPAPSAAQAAAAPPAAAAAPPAAAAAPPAAAAAPPAAAAAPPAAAAAPPAAAAAPPAAAAAPPAAAAAPPAAAAAPPAAAAAPPPSEPTANAPVEDGQPADHRVEAVPPPPVGNRPAPASATPVAVSRAPRRLVRALGWSAAVVVAVLTTVAVTRQHPAEPPPMVREDRPAGTQPAGRVLPEPAAGTDLVAVPPPSTATIGPPEPSAPPVPAPEPAPPPPSELAATAPPPRPSAGLKVESILTSPTYEHYACAEPTSHFSLRVHHRVNVCLQIAPMFTPVTEPVTVMWERNGAFYGRTDLTIPARHIRFRTRAHMILDERRAGDWSVRVLSRKGRELARSTFHVGP